MRSAAGSGGAGRRTMGAATLAAAGSGGAGRLRASGAVLAAAGLWLALVAGFAPSARDRWAAWAFRDPVPDGAIGARVAAVVDGDTIQLEDGRTVRVLGLDTPETHHPGMREPQALGNEASARMHDLVSGRVVHLESDATDRDHYGRFLRHVWVDRRLASEVLLEEGLARAMSIPPDLRHVDRLRAAEARAQASERGLWGLPRPTQLPIFGTSP